MDQNLKPAPGRRYWWLLLALQALIGGVLFHEFFAGAKYFSYADIGSDSHGFFTPQLMHLADYVRRDGWPTWSFGFGLGGAFLYPADPFAWLSILGGADQVLALRIWVYALKLLIGGWAFHAFLRRLPIDPAAALIGALAYTFCGYAAVNGQWDPMASEVAVYPVLLWAFAHRLQGGGRFALPLAVLLAIVSSGFVVALCVFAVYCFGLSVLAADDRLAHARQWLFRVVPLFGLGLLLAAPALLPNLLLLLDSPRVGDGTALLQRLGEAFSLNSPRVLLSELAGLFHQDLIGRGNHYVGWMNYLEGPGFYVGTLALLLIPQLAREAGRSRRLLLVGAVFIVLYFLSPVLRQLAFGFAVPYFRSSALWLSMLLLILAAFALDLVLRRNVDWRWLAGATLLVLATPLALQLALPAVGARQHLLTVLACAAAGSALLGAAAAGWLPRRWLPLGLLALVASEIVLVTYPGYHRQPGVVMQGTLPHADQAQRLIRQLQSNDAGFYRIEKTFDTISEADSLAQGYFGAKSYGFQGSSIVRLYRGLGLIPEQGSGVNPTNWLPGFGPRFPLYSLVGVKYVLSRQDENWPGLTPLGGAGDLRVYRNELALPFGVLHYRQIPEAAFQQSSGLIRDVAMLHGVVSEQPLPGIPEFALTALPADDLAALYVAAAQHLQQNGLRLSSFSPKRLTGEIDSRAAAVLVLSMPYQAGWTVRIDGVPTTAFRANLGLTAVQVPAGRHRVELSYFPPGLLAGSIAAAVGLLVLLAGVGAIPSVFLRRVLRSSRA